ncbi:MAG: endonuclease IV [Ruminococcaceae bacterium]|nr:endonuclease IV [Oscillospiraceae bacterium]
MKQGRVAPVFGPGGNSEAFHATRMKTEDAPIWLAGIGLDAYEYEAGRGVTASDVALTRLGATAKENGIYLSVHAPYFISLSGIVAETRYKSIGYIAESLHAAQLLGADTIVVHTGSAAKISREEAMRLAADTLYRTLEELAPQDTVIGLETMGKINQLGTLEEVIALCKMDKRLQPVVDFGHMNAREQGGVFQTRDDYRKVFDMIGNALGDDSARNLHCHFSKIEWTGAGEKKHLTFEDEVYGPNFEPLMETLYLEKLTPTIICESAGTQSDDALAMKKKYCSLI